MSKSLIPDFRKSRCRSREFSKISKESTNELALPSKKNGLLKTISLQQSPQIHSLNKNPSFPTINIIKRNKQVPSFLITNEESNLKKKIAKDLLIKNTENLAAYRLRLRNLFDTDFFMMPNNGHNGSAIHKNGLDYSILDFKENSFLSSNKADLIKKGIKRNNIRLKTSKDPFYFTNILANPKFSSFYDLLNIFSDSSSNFPYCSRINRNYPRPLNTIPVSIENDKPHNCKEIVKISLMDKKPLYDNHLASIKEIRKYKPWVNSIYLNIQETSCLNKMIIINLQSIVIKDTLILRPNLSKPIKSLIPHFLIILVNSNTELLLSEIFSALKQEEIIVSAVYEINNPGNKTEKIIDYSQIFIDFDIQFPNKDCIIITHHNICDETEVKDSGIIGKKIGSGIKLFSERIPLPSIEYPCMPVSILLTNPFFCSEFKSL